MGKRDVSLDGVVALVSGKKRVLCSKDTLNYLRNIGLKIPASVHGFSPLTRTVASNAMHTSNRAVLVGLGLDAAVRDLIASAHDNLPQMVQLNSGHQPVDSLYRIVSNPSGVFFVGVVNEDTLYLLPFKTWKAWVNGGRAKHLDSVKNTKTTDVLPGLVEHVEYIVYRDHADIWRVMDYINPSETFALRSTKCPATAYLTPDEEEGRLVFGIRENSLGCNIYPGVL